MASEDGELYGAEVLLIGCDCETTMATAAALAEARALVTVAPTPAIARTSLADNHNGFDAAAILDEFGDEVRAELVAAILSHRRPCHYVLVGPPERFPDLGAALKSGAHEVLIAPAARADLVHAIRRTCAQTSIQRARWLPTRRPPIAPAAADVSSIGPRVGVSGVVDRVASGSGLSERERVVLQYIARGYRYQEIGRELSISTRTVKSYASSLKRKVGAGTRWDLLRKMFAA